MITYEYPHSVIGSGRQQRLNRRLCPQPPWDHGPRQTKEICRKKNIFGYCNLKGRL